jgi:xanthine dehydrogenase accessory factor
VERRTELATGRVRAARPGDRPSALCDHDGWLHNTFGPEYRMLLIGAGQLTEYLATMALFSGFAVTVCDPREEYRGAWSVPASRSGHRHARRRGARLPRRPPQLRVALTHDPKLDDLALLEALETEAFYVGAIGSRRNNEARRARMVEHFDQTERLARLRGPDRHLHRQQDTGRRSR